MLEIENLKKVILDQEVIRIPQDCIEREEFGSFDQYMNSELITLFIGVRRSGKSTILQYLRQKVNSPHFYINFDDDRLVSFDIEDFQMMLELFIELYGDQKIIFLDEIQNVLGWERFIRRIHDQGYKIFITGSNANLFSKELGTRLTGRYQEVEVYPISFKEFVKHKNEKLVNKKHFSTVDYGTVRSLFAEYDQWGGFPHYLKERQDEYLKTLYENIIYRDVIIRYKIQNEHVLRELLLYLASNVSKKISFNKLKNILKASSATTISEWCYDIQSSFLCFVINRFSFSLKKQINYQKKIYFIDHALAKKVGFRSTEDRGRILENIVFLELKRRGKDIYFYKENNECDFILREGYSPVQAIQVTEHLDNESLVDREVTGLTSAMNDLKLEQGLLLVADIQSSKISQITKKYPAIKIQSIWEWLLH